MIKVRLLAAMAVGAGMFAASQAQAATVVVSESFAPFSFGSHTVALGAPLGGRRAQSGRLVVDAFRYTTSVTEGVEEASVQQDGYVEKYVALYEVGQASPDFLSISGASVNGAPTRQVATYANTGYPMYREVCSGGFIGIVVCAGEWQHIYSRYAGRDVTEGPYSITLDLTPEALEEINSIGSLTFNYVGSMDYYGGSNISRAEVTLQAAVPEPASWALMLAGFGGLGVALRRRRQEAAAT